jgi:ribosome-associated protein
MELSRSEQKRRIKQLGKLVVELVELSPAVLQKLPVQQDVRDYLLEAGSLKGGARKRQIKYITKLLRTEPAEPLYDFLALRKGGQLLEAKQFHEIEYLRDILIEEAIEARRQARAEHQDLEENWQSTVVRDIAEELPSVDQQGLNRLGFLFAMTRSKRHSREIFRMLQAAREQEALNRKTAAV